MAKLLRKLGQGLSAAGTIVGQHLAQEEQEKKADDIRKEKEAEDKRRFELRRADAEIRNEGIRLQNTMNKAKVNHSQLLNAAVNSEYNPATMADAMTKYSPDGKAYRYNEARSSEIGSDGVAFDVGTYTRNADGTFVTGEDGKPVFNSLPGTQSEMDYSNKDDFVNRMNMRMNPNVILAQQAADISEKQARKTATFMENLKVKTAEKTGVISEKQATANLRDAQVDKTEAETALLKEKTANPGKFQQASSATSRVSKVTDYKGNVTELTTSDVQRLDRDTKNLATIYEGISTEEVHNMGLMRKDPDAVNDINKIAQAVTDGDIDEDKAARAIAKIYKLKTSTAKRMVKEEMKGLTEKDSGSWWNIFD